MHKFLLFGAVGALGLPVLAQDRAPIEVDQNDFTQGTGVVERFQFENASLSQRRGQIRQYQLAESLLRIPAGKRAEVRATIPAYLIDRDLGFNGLDDARLDARVRFGSGEKTAIALTFGTTLPTGKREVAERKVQPQAILSASRALNDKTNLTANLGVARASDFGERFTQSQFALEIDHDLTPKFNLFGEVYGFNRLKESDGSQKFAAGGLVFRVNAQTALFGRGGAGLSNDVGSPDRFYQVGFARRF